MLWSLAALLLCEALGEVIHACTGLPVPAPVIGIALLLVFLSAFVRARPGAMPSLPAADALLGYLPLFFVPPGVGAVMQLGRLAHAWPAMLLGVTGSSIVTMAFVGWLAQGLLALRARPAPPPCCVPEVAS